MITKDNIISAYFIDEARENIEVLTTSEDKKSVIPIIVPLDENNPNFIELNGLVSVDQLHENTYNKKKKEKEIFDGKVIEIAKRNGMIVDNAKVSDNHFKTLVNALFDEQENPEHLFALKLALFEVNKIRNSKDSESKKKLRQAKNKIEALQIAFDLIR